MALLFPLNDGPNKIKELESFNELYKIFIFSLYKLFPNENLDNI